MMRWISVFIIAVSGSSLVTGQSNYTYATRTSLANHLLTGYDTMARPDASTNVTAVLVFTHMNGLDTINQILDVAGGILLSWTDPRLAWDTSVYNIDTIQVRLSDIWVLPMAIYNAAEGRQIFTNNDDTADEPLTVTSTGLVTWGHSMRIRSQCNMNIQFYPFDHQKCEIMILPWAYSSTEVRLVAGSGTIDTDAYAENGEWFLSKTSALTYPYTIAGITSGMVKFDVDLERKQSYYVMNILLPVVFLAFLGPIVFLLPVESGEKAGFSLTILLSLSVVMTIVSDQIPSTSTHVASLSIYLLVTYIMCVVEVLMTALTIRLHNFHSTGYKLPPKINRLLRRFLAPLVCYRRSTEKEKTENEEQKITPKMNTNKVGVRRISVLEKTDINLNLDLKRCSSSLGNSPWSVENIEEGEIEQDELIEYSYEELCYMLDTFHLYLFEAITILITLISFMTISIGGRQS